jgi:RNA polymerase sigma-70 factor (ECF subfamily)
MTEPPDEELVARLVAHADGRAFEALVRRHQSRVRNWLRQLTRDAALADDLAQDVFIVVWERAYSFAGKGSFVAWVMKVAYNQYLQARRKRGVPLVFGTEVEEATPDGQEWPDVAKMLAVVGPDERLVLTLCFAHGMSHGEVAEVLDMPLGTVKSHVQRGRAKIRARFGVPATRECGGGRE